MDERREEKKAERKPLISSTTRNPVNAYIELSINICEPKPNRIKQYKPINLLNVCAPSSTTYNQKCSTHNTINERMLLGICISSINRNGTRMEEKNKINKWEEESQSYPSLLNFRRFFSSCCCC